MAKLVDQVGVEVEVSDEVAAVLEQSGFRVVTETKTTSKK